MAISFTNTSGAGYNFIGNGTGTNTTNVPALTTPSDAGADKLLVYIWGAGQENAVGFSAQAPSLPNVTGESEITSTRRVGTTHNVEGHYFSALLSSSPTNLNANEATGGSRSITAVGLIFAGHDPASPIAAYATGEGYGTTITFPDTSSVSDGDYIIRAVIVGKENVTTSFSAFSGTTTIIDEPQSGLYKTAMYVGSSVKSGSGAPGTATLTLNASRDWIAATIVVKAASTGLSITSVTPTDVYSQQVDVVVAGTKLSNSAVVTFAGAACTGLSASSSTSLKITMPNFYTNNIKVGTVKELKIIG